MAGSYNHVVTTKGKLLDPYSMSQMLENGGDVYEAVEEMYGMIWWLAKGNPAEVDLARRRYNDGIKISPGKKKQ